jgi:4a-hydroxytetrahydrobiopterin dehydratase
MSLKKKDWNVEKRIALSATNIVANLAQLDGWKLSGDGDAVAIEKTFTFGDYFETIAFVNALAWVAHKQDHHPELAVFYNRCIVRLNTHDVRGISASDFECAALFDALLA